MKNISRYLFVVLSMFLALSAADGQTKKSEVSANSVAQLPWYFPEEIFQTSDPVKQHAQYARHLIEQYKCYQGDPNFMVMLSDADSFRIKTDLDSTSSATDPQAKMTLQLDHYVLVGKDPQTGENIYRVSTFCGAKRITQKQLDVVVQDMLAQAELAAKKDYEFFKDNTPKAITATAKRFNMPEGELRKLLDQKSLRFKNITYRDELLIPKDVKLSDFRPRVLHLGYNPEIWGGILGVAWLNTGVVYYNPQARVLDYLEGGPGILQHEMVHTNINLQEYPLTGAFDAELFASFPEMLYPERVGDFFFHSYTSPLRRLTKPYFGIDYVQVRKDIFRFNMAGNWVIDEAAFRKHYELVQKVKAELLPFSQDEVIPEFYSNQLWWSAFNKRRDDKNAMVRIAMAKRYELAGLGGRTETAKWLDAHREEIKEMYKEAWRKSAPGNNDDSGDTGERAISERQVPSLLMEQFRRMFTPDEQERIRQYFKQHPEAVEALLRMQAKDAMAFFKQFKTGGAVVAEKGGR